MKKAPVFLLSAAMMLSLAACGGGEAPAEGSTPPVDSTPQVQESVQPSEEPVQESQQPAQETETTQAEGDGSGETTAQGGNTAAVGDTVTLEGVDLELAVGEFQSGDKLGGDISVSSHSDTNKYFWLGGTVTNVGTETIDTFINDTMVTIVFDDTYHYEGSFLMRDDVGPFAVSEVYFWADVPPAMLEQYKTVKVVFGYNDGFGDYDWEKTDYEKVMKGYDHQYTFTNNG